MYNIQAIEEAQFEISSEAEWDRAEALETAEANPACCWVLTDRDVWHLNPYYRGPVQPYPEYADEEEWKAWKAEVLELESYQVLDIRPWGEGEKEAAARRAYQ